MLANEYFNAYDAKIDSATAVITILEQPQHGRLEPTSEDGDWTFSRYLPNDGYLGDDSFVMQVEGNGYKVKLHYFLLVTDDFVTQFNPNPVCKSVQWKISQDANGNSILTAVNYQPPTTSNTGSSTTATLASTLGASILSSLSADPSAVTLTLADLPGGAVGSTTGANITLDDNAAGHNWFIDYTPWLNEEYLPTYNPNEWQAKEGTEAYGKMDMLSVLLHEYGHALGIIEDQSS